MKGRKENVSSSLLKRKLADRSLILTNEMIMMIINDENHSFKLNHRIVIIILIDMGWCRQKTELFLPLIRHRSVDFQGNKRVRLSSWISSSSFCLVVRHPRQWKSMTFSSSFFYPMRNRQRLILLSFIGDRSIHSSACPSSSTSSPMKDKFVHRQKLFEPNKNTKEKKGKLFRLSFSSFFPLCL